MLKTLLATVAIVVCSGCAHPAVLSTDKEFWYNDASIDRGLWYCRANAVPQQSADPVCFKTRMFEKKTPIN